MDRHIGTHSFKVPAGSFLVFTLVASAISLTLIDRILVPTYQKLMCQPLTSLQPWLHRPLWSDQLASSTSAVSMSAFWLVIPLALVGEAFHFPGQVALYYQEFPVSYIVLLPP
ncbi:hypothetical protein MKW94_000218 [Papaver nudicaule]|uniref:Uncharacterized protein n=1 Tax=Papaver nudicaule TaxID=74823 RepID=A0AA41VL27_PAPNU|nr:hypothetical protein [Papaver nudicaule]